MRHQRKKLIKILLYILILTIGTLAAFNQFVKRNANDPIAKNHVKTNSLKEAVDNVLKGTEGTYGIAIKNLKTGETYYSSEHKVFEVGSLYKLWIMATAYKQIQSGQLTEDQVLSEDVVTLNGEFNIDPNSVELTEGTITLTVHDAIYQMITISHNYAALLLTEKIKLSSVAAFLGSTGLDESTVGTNGGSPTATPFDIGLFFEKLYKGELANQQYTQEMIDILKNQQLNAGLPKYLPVESKIADKTGDIGWFKHDAGIVFTNKGDYIIVVMSESDSPPNAQEKIALVSKAVFDYFQNRF